MKQSRIFRHLAFKFSALLTQQPSLRVLFDQTQLRSSYRRLQAAGLSINTVYDVGAHRGSWAEAGLDLFPLAQFHCFDPLPYAEDWANRQPRACFYQLLLGDKETQVPFFQLAPQLIRSIANPPPGTAISSQSFYP